MKLRPTIFLSGVSSEFRSFRDAVEVEVQKKGCFAENQSSFGVDYHTVEEMVRRRISDADAVIHIVGFRFGAEPKDRPADKPRRSYTQMEYDIARELEKPIYVFLSSDAGIADALGTDDTEESALQLAHRQTIQDDKSLYYFFNDKAELCKLAGEIETVAHAEFGFEISRIDRYAPGELIGREDELALLNDAWLKVRRAEPRHSHVLTFVALGGEGKTSLIAKWLADLAFQNWPGCDSAFAWSFYSQGTREQYADSSDLFLKEAITFFGDAADKEFAASPAGAYEKGQRLARIVGGRRALLVLDGLEPLQYALTSPTPGELKDGGITALLKGLAARSDGLCIVTTRYSLPNLKAFWQTTAPEIPLTRLSQAAGVHLLKTLGVKGATQEFETLVEDIKGHALTLNLLGTYLRDAHAGDIRRRDLIKLEEADAEQGGHAFRVLEAYDEAFEREGERGKRALAMLRLHGFFDRPITADFLTVLLQQPAIPDLTDSLVGSSEAQRNIALKRLEDAKLVTMNWGGSGTLVSVDAHPLLREYSARHIRKEPSTWREAHYRLYRHLRDTTPDKPQPTVEDLQPLYQAVVHGCHAGLQQEVFAKICYWRIWRQRQEYTIRNLGLFGSELSALTCFFEQPWTHVSPSLSDQSTATVLNNTSFCLRALGRLTEALEPLRVAREMFLDRKSWESAAIASGNLSSLELLLGDLGDSELDAKDSVTYADRSKDILQRIGTRATHSHVLHEVGRFTEADRYFRDAERLKRKWRPASPMISSTVGFYFCGLLLSTFERDVWQVTMGGIRSAIKSTPTAQGGRNRSVHKSLKAVLRRANYSLGVSEVTDWVLERGLSSLTIARATFYEELLASTELRFTGSVKLIALIDDAVNELRRAGAQEYIVSGLLTRASIRYPVGSTTEPHNSQDDLDEAWEIAERGPMRLFMADVHLYRARLFFREKDYPWESPEADLKAARKLIEQCGYWRRKEELEDAERVILKEFA